MRLVAPFAALGLSTAASLGAPVGASTAAAQERGTSVEARVGGYTDDDDTDVLRPYVAARLAGGPARLGVAYSADVVSSASVDVVSRATSGIDETRHQVVADAAYVGDDGLVLGGSWSGGFEPDHQSQGGALRGEVDLDGERLWHGALVLGGTWSAIGTVVDPRFHEESFTYQGAAALARVFDAWTVGRVALEGSVTTGYQSSPYRTVRLGDWTAMETDRSNPDLPAWIFSGVTGVAREQHPDLRVRSRLGLDVARELGSNVAIVGRLAGYADDWGILAIDGNAEVRIEPEEDLVVRLGARVYAQGGAWFWRRRYLDPSETSGIVTGDRELGPMRSYTLLAAVAIPVDLTRRHDVRLDARLEGIRWEYPEFDLLTERHALSLIVGFTWTPDYSLF